MVELTEVQQVEQTVENVAQAIASLAKVDWTAAAASFKNGIGNPSQAIATAENVASAIVGAVAIVDPALGATLSAADAVGSSFLNTLSKFIP